MILTWWFETYEGGGKFYNQITKLTATKKQSLCMQNKYGLQNVGSLKKKKEEKNLEHWEIDT